MGTDLAAIDLFSGCGGLSLGLQRAGFRILAAVDTDELAMETYRLNHSGVKTINKDIRKVSPNRLMKTLGLRKGQLALLAGCPPCQGFSTLRTLNGKNDIDEPMNDLIFEFVRFVRAFLPRAIMIENVPGLANDERIVAFRKRIEKLGYTHATKVLDASDFGVPQRRKRMIMIAVRNAKAVEFAAPSKRKRSVRGAIKSLSAPEKSRDPMHNYETRRTPGVLKRISKVPKDGGSRSDLRKNYRLACHDRCSGFKDVYGRMRWSAPAPTITGGCINPSKGRFLHPEQDRAITLREAAMLQGFPKSYNFEMRRGLYPTAQMIGNAFPPEFAARHAKTIKRKLATT
ncbi:MAG: DNA cytosine methyltransferase [Rhizomicrobium sp.]